MLKKLALLMTLIVIGVLYLNSYTSFSSEKFAKIKKGIYIVEEKNLEKIGIIHLDGEWEFYWNQILNDKQIIENQYADQKYFKLPNSWNTYKSESSSYPSKGYATYRLKIINESKKDLGLRFGKIFTSAKVFVNNEPIYEVGRVGKSRDEYVADTSYRIITVNKNIREFSIVIQVSNFIDNTGGIWESILIGEKEEIFKLHMNHYVLESFIFGILLIMGLYHLIFYFIHKDDYTFLIFGIFCILMSIRVITTGEIIIKNIFPYIDWIIIRKIEFFIFYTVVPLFIIFLYSLYPQDVKKKVVISLGAVGGFFGLIVLFTSNEVYTKLVSFYQFITVGISLFGMYILVKAFFRKREGAALLILGGLVLFLTVINDIYFNVGVIKSTNLFPLGITIFILLYSMVLAIKFKKIKEDKIESDRKADFEKHQKEIMIKINEIDRRSLNKIKLLQQVSSIIYKEKDLKKVAYYLMYIIIAGMDFGYKKGMYFILEQDKNKLKLAAEIKNVNRIDFNNLDLIEAIEVIVAKSLKEISKEIEINLNLIDGEFLSKIIEVKQPTFFKYNDEMKNYADILGVENMMFCPISYENTVYGLIVFEKYLKSEEILEEEIEVLKIISNSLAIYIEKMNIELERLNIERETPFRCKSCNKKLFVYKGNADYIEVKCPSCNTLNKL